MNAHPPLDPKLMQLGGTVQAQRPTIARWWARKLHGQWTYPEGIRAAVVVSAALWGGIAWLVL